MPANATRHALLAVAGLICATPWNPAAAQAARSGSGANAQLLQQLQQLASERTSLQAENAKMKAELEGVRKERDALKKAQQATDLRVKASEGALARSAAEKASADQDVQQLKGRMQELVAKFRETVQTLREIEADRATAKQTLASREQALKVCLDHNAALYKLNGEVLDRLEHRGFWSRAAAAEPFTQIKRAQLQNLVDDYKYRAEEQRVKPGSPVAAPAEQPSTASPPAAEPKG